jgi:hypothetical protein
MLVGSFARFIFLFMRTARRGSAFAPTLRRTRASTYLSACQTPVGRTVRGEPRSMGLKMNRAERLEG